MLLENCTTKDLDKVVNKEDLLLDIHFYNQELVKSSTPEERKCLKEKISKAEELYLAFDNYKESKS
jgi:hypothetical protein